MQFCAVLMVRERNGVCAKLPRSGNSGDALRAKGGFGCKAGSRQLFQCGKPHADGKQPGRRFDLLGAGKAGGNTDVAVLRVAAIGARWNRRG